MTGSSRSSLPDAQAECDPDAANRAKRAAAIRSLLLDGTVARQVRLGIGLRLTEVGEATRRFSKETCGALIVTLRHNASSNRAGALLP